jgi:hypothetical protein
MTRLLGLASSWNSNSILILVGSISIFGHSHVPNSSRRSGNLTSPTVVISISNQDSQILDHVISSAANWIPKSNALPDRSIISPLDQMEVDRQIFSWLIQAPLHAICQGRASILSRAIPIDNGWLGRKVVIAGVGIAFRVAATVVYLSVIALSGIERGAWITGISWVTRRAYSRTRSSRNLAGSRR